MDRPDREAIAGQVRRVFEHDLRGNLEFHRAAPGHVIHVACSTLRREPMEVRREIYGRTGVDWTDEAVDRAARPQGERGGPGAHRYSRDGWGIPPAAVAELFGDYRSTFSELVAT